MNQSTEQVVKRSRRFIFLIQIGLLILLSILAGLDYVSEDVKAGSFFYAVILGALGASISLMRRATNEDAQLLTQLTTDRVFSIMVPILYGVLMAGIGYLLFMSEILSGDNGGGLFTTNLFPNFTDPTITSSLLRQFIEMEPDGMKNTGKLLVWSFIAGYSERFIAGILGQLEKQGKA